MKMKCKVKCQKPSNSGHGLSLTKTPQALGSSAKDLNHSEFGDAEAQLGPEFQHPGLEIWKGAKIHSDNFDKQNRYLKRHDLCV